MSAILNNFWVSPSVVLTSGYKPRCRASVKSLAGGGDSAVVSTDSVRVNGVSSVGDKDKVKSLVDVGNGWLGSSVEEKKNGEDVHVPEKLETLWDDGYGTQSVKDYLDLAKDIIKPDGGPPRWFCPVSGGGPLADSPVLLFLPGMDGLGLGLILHEKALGRFGEITVHDTVHNIVHVQEASKC